MLESGSTRSKECYLTTRTPRKDSRGVSALVSRVLLFCPILLCAAVVFLSADAHAVDCHTFGSVSDAGARPNLVIENAVAGQITTAIVTDLPAGADKVYLCYSRETQCLDLESLYGAGALLVPDVAFDGAADPPFDRSTPLRGDGATRFRAKVLGERQAGWRFFVQAFIRGESRGDGTYDYVFTNVVDVTIQEPNGVQEIRAGHLPDPAQRIATFFDPESEACFLFGGRSTDRYLGSTYKSDFGGALGSRLEYVGEAFEPRASMISLWDPAARKGYLLGGLDAPFPRLRDIFVFEPGDGTGAGISPSTDTLPFAIGNAACTWAEPLGRGFILGGLGTSGEILDVVPGRRQFARVVFADALPDSRIGAAAVWDTDRRRVLVFGGFSQGVPTNQIIEFVPEAQSGERVRTLSWRLPYTSGACVAVWDSRRKVAYIGGFADAPNIVVRLDPATGGMTQIQTTESLLNVSGVYDDVHDRILFFGGTDSEGRELDRVWQFDASNWANGVLDRLRGGRSESAACMDTETGDMYLFGGRIAGGGSTNEIVRISLRESTEEQVRVLPITLSSGRYNATAAWDPTRGKAYIFGGQESFSPNVTEILEFDPNVGGQPRLTWAGTLAFPVAGATAIWDSYSRRVLLFGGKSDYDGHVLAYDPGTRSIEILDDRLERDVKSPAVAWDDEVQCAYIFGGVDLDPIASVIEYDPRRPEGSRLDDSAMDDLPQPNGSIACYWNSREDVAYLVGGSVTPNALVRFDPSAPNGSQVETVATLEGGFVGGNAFYDRDFALPIVTAASVPGFEDAITILRWD